MNNMRDNSTSSVKPKPLPYRTLMVQGTTSDAGKSTLVAAICRILSDRGFSVVPFKPQNMALNSAVTEDGGEIGRAQAVQAQAARLQPRIDMNPVLLKPNTDTGAQVIIHGHSIGNMEALDYHEYKTTAMAAVLESHERLLKEFDAVIVEGAGSPAEINLRDRDIANMGFAEAVDCPVIIIADIDKGGVFAHLVGTLELLSKSEQDRVIGFVINRFRGDIALLQSGLDWLEDYTGKPVLGVVPYLHHFHLEAEDAIADPKKSLETSSASGSSIKIAVLLLPKISNHTDFDPLALHPQVELTFVDLLSELGECDLIIIPGSKSVRSDLSYLRETGWAEKINRHLRYGGKVLGVCGGFQMLGQSIDDPMGVEGELGCSTGLSYLDMNTQLYDKKQLMQRTGFLADKQKIVCGYEIHAGLSLGPALDEPLFFLHPASAQGQASIGESKLEAEGCISADRQIAGSYLHGLFDHQESREWLLSWAGLESVESFDYMELRETEIQRLADCVAKSMSAAKNLLGA